MIVVFCSICTHFSNSATQSPATVADTIATHISRIRIFIFCLVLLLILLYTGLRSSAYQAALSLVVDT